MLLINQTNCRECGACVAVCRPMSLELFCDILRVYSSCNDCGICVIMCPTGALKLEKDRSIKKRIKNEKVLASK